ncbi:MAG TPA: pyrroloquinoline quinone biosynthesis protein PqqE [Alphaproteobacteria bacterium]|jgi:pyrroloquinoline quinone biosynthesis protein E|nr:pyrroloquinoline quinone biosynthesis protein PqqE [Alphaproteobacteria bacterium]
MPKDGSAVRLDGEGKPLWLCCELTYRCPLKCPWCNNPLDFDDYRNELSTEEWKRVFREGRKLGSLQLGLTGGEPLMRDDIVELTAYANELGYYTNLITSGIGLSEERLIALKDAGLKQVQLSIQSCDREVTDTLVGARAHDLKLEAARIIKKHGFPMVLNIPVVRQNIDKVQEYLDMAEALKVDYLEFANVQYYNWAALNRDALLPTREQLERAEAAVMAARERLGQSMTIYFVIPDYYAGRPKACMNGWGAIHFTIAPDGSGLPCQEARIIKDMGFPSVRDHDLQWIWRDSPAFNRFRGFEWMKEPCRSCDDRVKDFGGCRCQAYLLTGDANNCDPACAKSPDHHLVEEAITDAFRPGRFTKPLVLRRPHATAPSA